MTNRFCTLVVARLSSSSLTEAFCSLVFADSPDQRQGPQWGKSKSGLSKSRPFFPYFWPRAIFYFLANFFPFLDFGPFSILYQAAWLATNASLSSNQQLCKSEDHPSWRRWPCTRRCQNQRVARRHQHEHFGANTPWNPCLGHWECHTLSSLKREEEEQEEDESETPGGWEGFAQKRKREREREREREKKKKRERETKKKEDTETERERGEKRENRDWRRIEREREQEKKKEREKKSRERWEQREQWLDREREILYVYACEKKIYRTEKYICISIWREKQEKKEIETRERECRESRE